MLTPAEIERRANEQLRALGPKGIAEFLSSLDDLGSEIEPDQTTEYQLSREDLPVIMSEAAKRHLGVTLIPQSSDSDLTKKARQFAHKAVVSWPELKLDEEALYEQVLTAMKSSKENQRVADCIEKIARDFKGEPEIFVTAINELDGAREIYDGNGGSLWTIVNVDLLKAILMAQFLCKEKVQIAVGSEYRMEVRWYHKASDGKIRVLNALRDMICAGGAAAKRLQSDALPIWKKAITLFCQITHTTYIEKKVKDGKRMKTIEVERREENGTPRDWKQKEVDELFALLKSARETMFADTMICDYMTGEGVR